MSLLQPVSMARVADKSQCVTWYVILYLTSPRHRFSWKWQFCAPAQSPPLLGRSHKVESHSVLPFPLTEGWEPVPSLSQDLAELCGPGIQRDTDLCLSELRVGSARLHSPGDRC